MNILLVSVYYSKEPRNPIAILDLAAWLRQSGHTVDCHYLHNLPDNSYDLVGLSALQGDDDTIISAAIYLKERFNTLVVVGGKWANRSLESTKQKLFDHHITIHAEPGEFFFNSHKSINYKNYPSWQEIDFKTLGEVQPEIMTTRGCPNRCNFCNNTEKQISFFSAKRSVDNFETISKHQPIIFIVDDVFTICPDHIMDIYHEASNRGISLTHKLKFFSHVNFIKPPILDCIDLLQPVEIQIGFESGDNDILKLMSKGFTSEKAKQSAKLLYDHIGPKICALFLIGFPGETTKSLDNTLKFVDSMRKYFCFIWTSYYQPVRGTIGYEMAMKKNPNFTSLTNEYITYVEPGLTPEILQNYRERIMGLK